MEKILVLFFLVCGLNSIQAQEKFIKYYTNNGSDFGEGICQLPDSSYLITGSSSSFEDAPAQTFLLKIDKTGAFQWSKAYGGSENDWGKRVFYVKNDGIYIAGFTNSEGQGSYDFQLLKTDETGTFLWSKTVGGVGMELLNDAIMLGDTSFVLLGSSTSTSNGQENIFLVRMDKMGDTIWTKKIGNDGSDIGHALAKMSDSSFAIAGDYFDQTVSFQKGIIAKFHKDGTEIWRNLVGNLIVHSFNSICFHDNQLKFGGHQINATSGLKNYYLGIYDTDGTYLQVRIDSTLQGDYTVTNLLPYGDSTRYYVVVQFSDPTLPSFPIGDDILIHGYSEYLYWAGPSLFPSLFGQDQANQVIPTSDGGVILVGFNSYYGKGGNNVLVVKIGPLDDFPVVIGTNFDSNLVSVSSLENTTKLQVFPNPSSDIVHVNLHGEHVNSYTLRDVLGREIWTSQIESGDFIVNLSAFKSGIYYLVLHDQSKQTTIKLIKE